MLSKKRFCIDLTVNEKIWGHKGWGEPQSSPAKRITNKPGVCKGGYVVLVSDVDRIWPHTYVHKKIHGIDQRDLQSRVPMR